jgi:hypothetical protein
MDLLELTENFLRYPGFPNQAYTLLVGLAQGGYKGAGSLTRGQVQEH